MLALIKVKVALSLFADYTARNVLLRREQNISDSVCCCKNVKKKKKKKRSLLQDKVCELDIANWTEITGRRVKVAAAKIMTCP